MSDWFVVIEEQTGNGEGRQWRVTHVAPAGDSAAAAEETALRTAREYQPEHPWLPRRRRVLRMAAPGSFLVTMEGRTATFHFRVSVGQQIYDEPETGLTP